MERRPRRRLGRSLAVSLLLHALALAALAWATGSWLRVAAREAPVFVTLLAAVDGVEPAAPMPTAPTPAPVAPPAQPAPSATSLSVTAPSSESTPTARRAARPTPARRPPARAEQSSAPSDESVASGSGLSVAPAPSPEGTAAGAAAAPAAASAGRVYGENEVDRAAVALGGIRRPEYPARERMLGREGRVTLRVQVDATGKVDEVTVARSAGEAFDASARRAVERTPFRAARLADRDVPSIVTVDVSFELE